MAGKKIKNMVYISLGAVLMAVCSFITVPFAVPFTMQTFGLFSVLFLLGGKKGSGAILLYIFMGAIGMPIFSGFGSGFGYLLGPTGGFIFGFALGGAVYWLMEKLFENNAKIRILGAISVLLSCYVTGTAWYLLYSNINGSEIGIISALILCVFPYVMPDILKLSLAYIIWKRVAVHIKA